MKLGRHSEPSNKKSVLTKRKSRSEANIAGYEKRRARKANSTLTTDLYEHIAEKTHSEVDDDEIDRDDDEEVDSDAAFEESDEERFAGFFSHKKEEREEEEEEEEEEGDDDEFIDLVDVCDEEIPQALDQLNDFVSNLDVTSTKRKAADEVDASTNTRKRRLVEERTEAGVENEFRAPSSGLKLNIDDLLAPLASQSSALQSLKTSAKVLASSSSKAKTLSAPLPQRTQDRLDRQTAYDRTKEEVDKWSETMKHIREAEHLSFPLQSQSAGRVSNLELTAKFKPTTTLESSVDALLKSAKLRDEEIHHTEEAMLQMNQLSTEEIAQRRGELRKMRELMFRAEVKARRTGKIKSKTYRRQMRKKEDHNKDSKGDIQDTLAQDEKHCKGVKGVGSGESENGLGDWRDNNGHDRVVQVDGDESDRNSEVEVQETALTLKGKGKENGIKAFEQRDLIALAFAGDNVVQSFEGAKRREIASDAPREVDTTIPGWGSWGGVGVRKLPPKPQRIKKIAGIDPTTRADFNKKHIIISEKRDKKAGKYLVKDLPYPYTSKAQFERAMENPLGAEWNTRVAFQRGTLPKVVKKPGVIINPLEKLTS